MATLRDVAERAGVSVLVAFQALRGQASISSQEQTAVMQAATALSYSLSVTIKDVAALAKVSIATVSYVLNDSHPVSTMTKTAVLDAAEALEYRPNVMARNLQSNQSRLIGYGWHRIKPGQSVPLLDRFTYWMAQAAEAAGYHVLTFSNPDDEPTAMYEELIKTNRVDGFVLAHTNRNDPRIRFLMKAGIPFAAFGRANDSWHFPYVDSDGKTGISLAVQHLIGLGHTQIAILGWPEGSLTGDNRLEGYFSGLEAGSIAPRNELVVRTENTIASAYAATVALLSRPNAPTALVCLSDTMAIGAMNYMNHMGIAIGKSIAITGFDDDPVAEVFYPGLTTLRQPIDQIAAQVVALFLAEVGNERPNNYQILLAPELIVRGSSDPNCT